MPTHIVIREPKPAPQDPLEHLEVTSDNNSTSTSLSEFRRAKTPIRGVVGFRSSIVTISPKKEAPEKLKDLHLSRDDLRASPRLQGYLYMMVASIVNVISSVRYLTESKSDDVSNDEKYVSIEATLVLTWKLYGAIAVSSAGVFFPFLILLVHFDFYFWPRLWKAIFRDGSKGELCLLLLLFLFWVGGLQVCTSAFSVGTASPNVYFTTWIAFGSVILNLGVWRKGADLPTLSQIMWSHERETMHNWFIVWVFSMISALAIADLYASRDDLQFLLDGEFRDVSQREWNMALSLSFAVVAVSAITMVCDHYLTGSRRFKCCGGNTIELNWRHVEGFLALSMVGGYSWIIIEYTGVNFPLNGPSNAYFGAWGVFFASLSTFGTWLHENKTIEVVVKEPEEEQEAADDAGSEDAGSQ